MVCNAQIMAIETHSRLWIKSKSSIVIADLDVNDLSRNGGRKDEADE